MRRFFPFHIIVYFRFAAAKL